MVNRDTNSNKLQQMKDEILLLREELDRAKLETKLLSSKSRSSVGDDGTQVRGDEECRAGEGGESKVVRDTRQHLEELEDCLNQCQLRLSSYLRCLSSVRSLLVRALGRDDGNVEEEGPRGMGSEEGPEGTETKEVLRECLHLITACSNNGAWESDMHVEPPSSDEAIAQLRSELVRCRMDLWTDELAFAEKGEEMSELQHACDVLVQEKERLEGMWVAAQESEAALQTRVEQLTGKLAALEVGGADEGGEELGVSVHTEEQSVAEDSLSSGAVASPEEQQFAATRSLLRGKVKIDSLEVRDREGLQGG